MGYRRKESGRLESQTPSFDKSRLTRKSCQYVSTICSKYLALQHVDFASTLCHRSQFKEYCYAKKFAPVIKTPISVSLPRFFQFSRQTKRQLSSFILLVSCSVLAWEVAKKSLGTWVLFFAEIANCVEPFVEWFCGVDGNQRKHWTGIVRKPGVRHCCWTRRNSYLQRFRKTSAIFKLFLCEVFVLQIVKFQYIIKSVDRMALRCYWQQQVQMLGDICLEIFDF